MRQNTSCYGTLDEDQREIRLFELLPGEKDDALRGRLTTVSLDANPQYDAVSYVWGDPQLRFPLIINDGQTILITESLQVALPCLRLKDEPRVLWIDAICINQGDDQERGHQVGMMKDVYSRARCVRIWMDVDVDLTSPAFHAAQQLKASRNCFQFDDESSRSSDLGQTKELTDHEPEFWAPMHKIFAHTYWERHLLRHNEDVYSVREARKLLFYTMSVGFWVMRKQYKVRSAVPTLLRLFLRSMGLKTSDPRDWVYGFVGLALGYHEGDFAPDYTLTRFQTYSLVVKHYVRKYQSVDFLCYYLSGSTDRSLPTWLPMHEALLLTTDFASKSTAVPVSSDIVEFDGRLMALRGIRCNRVSCRAADPNFSMTISELITQLEAISAELGVESDPFASAPFLELLESWALGDVKLEDLSRDEFRDHVVDLIGLVSSEGLEDSDPMDVESSLGPDLEHPENRTLKFFILGLHRLAHRDGEQAAGRLLVRLQGPPRAAGGTRSGSCSAAPCPWSCAQAGLADTWWSGPRSSPA
ncbi:uncharacterized protein E0L32_000090 [Thyridium curvatum]|uniref:Heterokaryon incompatibility domain-containing protein n=1 Tax=Thyridium curvatum TaxID=1093900 RepID=A0A507B9C0_9PEZI|nr:uncharacterized protein E0L32_000090 [Thyridium curvatum]TPX15756.1 hypothetical protein E0L32_000090 [Thyridium curvatum]